MRVTYLRVRPANTLAEPTAVSRRREGTTTVEVGIPTSADIAAGFKGGVLVVARKIGDDDPAAWVVDPGDALLLASRQVAPWRLTVVDSGPREKVLDAIARSRSAYLRTTRSAVARATQISSLLGIETSVSVFVDDVTQAGKAVSDGATDLLLRDWSGERLGELRDSLPEVQFVERTAFPPGVEIDEAREGLPKDIFTTWLNQVDGSGAARPRYGWAPGKDMDPPVPVGRLSAEWMDAEWVGGTGVGGLGGAGDLAPVLERSLNGHAPTVTELEELFMARGDQIDAVAQTADDLRKRAVGDTVTYVVNRNINYTNLCYFKCGFCAFSKGPKSLNLRGEPYLMGLDEIVDRSREAWDRGATEVTLQGGIHPTSMVSPHWRSGRAPRPLVFP